MLRAILLSSIVLNIGLLLGRFSGFIREALVAASFGATFEADIVVLMLTVPDLMVSLLMGGAMGAILIPAFSQNPEIARKLLYQSAMIFLLLFCIVTAGIYWQVQALVTLLVPGFDSDQIEEAVNVVRIVLWLIPLTVLAGTTTAYLHYQNRFITPSLGTLIVNCTIIVGLYLVFIEQGSIETLAAFVLMGGFLRFASQVIVIRPGYSPVKSFRPFLLRQPMIVQYGQAMLSGSLLFMFPVVARAFASLEGPGNVAILNYSVRLVEFPLAVGVSFLTVVLFPKLSESFNSNQRQHRQYIKYGIQATLALSLLATITLILLVDEYSLFVFGYGEMSKTNVENIAMLISVGLLVLPLQGLSVYITAIFYSRANTRTPMLINGFGLLFFVGALNLGLFGSGLLAIMWGLVAGFAIICALQLITLKIENLNWASIYWDKPFLLGGICAIGFSILFNQWIVGLQLFLWLKLLMGLGGALFCLLVIALFYPEIRAVLKSRLGIIG